MGNKSVKEAEKPVEQERKEIPFKYYPFADLTYVKWLNRDLEKIYGFSPTDCPAVKPPDHYIEFMRSNGWLDVDLGDPDLAHLFRK